MVGYRIHESFTEALFLIFEYSESKEENRPGK
jgi:hypothetical protein